MLFHLAWHYLESIFLYFYAHFDWSTSVININLGYGINLLYIFSKGPVASNQSLEIIKMSGHPKLSMKLENKYNFSDSLV